MFSNYYKYYKKSIEQQEKIAFSLQTQIDRIGRMDDDLYEDKLAGEISKERYKVKREQFIAQKIELEKQLKGHGKSVWRSAGTEADTFEAIAEGSSTIPAQVAGAKAADNKQTIQPNRCF